MTLLAYFALSFLDFFSIMYFILSVNSYRIKLYIVEMVTSVFILATVSTALTYYNIRSIAPLIQIVIFILMFIFIFKQKLITSLWVTVAGYVISGLIQAALMAILIISKVALVSELVPNSTKGNATWIAYIIINILLAMMLKNKFAFEFYDNPRYNGKRIRIRIYWTIGFLSVILGAVTFIAFFIASSIYTLLLYIAIFSLLVILFHIYSKRRNKEEYAITVG